MSPWRSLWRGGIAQLGERLLCKQEVIGSIPFASTSELFHQCADVVGKKQIRLSRKPALFVIVNRFFV